MSTTYRAKFEIELEITAKDVFEAKRIAEECIVAHVKKNPPIVSKLEVVRNSR